MEDRSAASIITREFWRLSSGATRGPRARRCGTICSKSAKIQARIRPAARLAMQTFNNGEERNG
jgi:hypothetical protein